MRFHWHGIILGVLILSLASCGTSVTTTVPGTRTSTTATAAPATRTYTAAIPGPGCDHGGGIWKKGYATTVTCTVKGLQLGNDYGSDFGVAIFVSAPGFASLPPNFRVSVDLGAQARTFGEGIIFFDQSGSSVDNVLIDDGGDIFVELSSGTSTGTLRVPVATPQHLVLTVGGGKLDVTVSNHHIGTYPCADCHSLGLQAGAGTARRPASGTFANFSLTALP